MTDVGIGPDGMLWTVAGDGSIDMPALGDASCATPGLDCPGPALQAKLRRPEGLALAPDGTLYIVDACNDRLRAVSPDGRIRTVAGGQRLVNWCYQNPAVAPTYSEAGNGGPAFQAALSEPTDVSVGSNGSVYLSESANAAVRRIYIVNGVEVIDHLAGGTTACSTPDCAAGTAAVGQVQHVAASPDGSIWLNAGYWGVRRVRSAASGLSLYDGLIPSTDGSELYVFDSAGHHTATIDALTNVTSTVLGYANGLLATLTDRDSRVTTIHQAGRRAGRCPPVHVRPRLAAL